MEFETLQKASRLNRKIELLGEYLSQTKGLSSDKGKLSSVIFNFTRREAEGCCDTVGQYNIPSFAIEVVGQDNIMQLFAGRLEFELEKYKTELSQL